MLNRQKIHASHGIRIGGFIQLFGKVVFGVDDEKFDHVLDSAKTNQGVTEDSKLNVESLKNNCIRI